MAFAPLVIAAVGAAMTVASSMQQASAAKSAANFNSQVAANNAVAAQQQAQQQAEAVSRSSAQQLGAARAAYGASGVTSEGSPLDVLASSASLGELDRQTVLYRGHVQAAGYANEQSLDQMRGDSAQQQAYGQIGGAIVKGGATAYGYGSASGWFSGGDSVNPSYSGATGSYGNNTPGGLRVGGTDY